MEFTKAWKRSGDVQRTTTSVSGLSLGRNFFHFCFTNTCFYFWNILNKGPRTKHSACRNLIQQYIQWREAPAIFDHRLLVACLKGSRRSVFLTHKFLGQPIRKTDNVAFCRLGANTWPLSNRDFELISSNLGTWIAPSVYWLGYGLDDRGSVLGRG